MGLSGSSLAALLQAARYREAGDPLFPVRVGGFPVSLMDWTDTLRVVRLKTSDKVHAARVSVEKCAHGETGSVSSECHMLRSSLDRVVLYDEDPPVVNCLSCRNGLRRWADWKYDEAQRLRNQAERVEASGNGLLRLLGADLQEAS